MYSRLEIHCFRRVKETIKLLGNSIQCCPLCGLLACFGNIGSFPLTALNSTLSGFPPFSFHISHHTHTHTHTRAHTHPKLLFTKDLK